MEQHVLILLPPLPSKTLQIMKGVSARTYSTNYSTTDSGKLVHQLTTSTGALQTTYIFIQDENKTDKINGLATDRSD